MPVNPQTAFGPPPLGTPLTAQGPDQAGIRFEDRQQTPVAGNLSPSWSAWFNGLFRFISTTEWTPYTPTTAQITGISTDAAYSQAGKSTFVRIFAAGVGTGLGLIALTLPEAVTPKGNQFLPCQVSIAGVQQPCWSQMSPSTNTVIIELFSGTFTGPVSVLVEGVYEAQ